jgi:beta-mannosidase
MSSPIRGSSLSRRELLSTGWSFCAVPSDAFNSPSELREDLNWLNATAPCTAASALRDLGQWSFESPPRRFDADDWWFRCEFVSQSYKGRVALGFDGLATLADVWLNGEQILSSENMFIAHEVDITARLKSNNSLYLRFRSLDKALTAKRPRPRWKAPMIENQQLRWFRTTVLGRTPGWSPSAAAVGPWRPVWLEYRDDAAISNLRARASVEGANGTLHLDLQHAPIDHSKLVGAILVVSKGEQRFSQVLTCTDSSIHGEVAIPNVERWWPHTHGTPSLYSAQLSLEIARESGDLTSHTIDVGNVGFRTVRVDTTEGQFRVLINEVPIFCRGACWTPIDSISLAANGEDYVRAIEQVRAAGMNMIRIAGTMIYEDDALLLECDRQGILIWQEFMFANMDFPEEEARFVASVESEVRQQLSRLRPHPALAVLCGNSEVEQQAAMFGTTRDRWSPRLFHELIRNWVGEEASDHPYWPSSAHGGAFPHQPDVGTTSYYGVGAYLRSIEDARRSTVKFATECLAFANPAQASLASREAVEPLKSYSQESVIAQINSDRHTQHAFEYVRDFYLARLFDVNPRELFETSRERYMHLGEMAAGEVMSQCFDEWRRPGSACGGALIWFWRDLVPSHGWGIVDTTGQAKPPFYYLRRALRPLRVFLTDEGCNQPAVHVVNDTIEPFTGTVTLRAFGKDHAAPLERSRQIHVEAHAAFTFSSAELLEWFIDLGYVFQFGAPTYDILQAELISIKGTSISDATLLPLGLGRTREDPQLSATIVLDSGTPTLFLRTNRFAECVRIVASGHMPEENYFHMLPGSERSVRLFPCGSCAAPRVAVGDLNSRARLNLSLA